MTSRKDQIQALIAEIEGALSKNSPRLPWVISGEAMEQRQLLERARRCLASMQADEAQTSPSSLSVPQLQPPDVQVLIQEALRQQREAMMEDFRQMQQQMMGDMMQAMMGRLQQSLAEKLDQALTAPELRSLQPDSLSGALPPGDAASTTLLTPAQRLEQLQVLQERSDKLLMSLDTTLNVVFETLQGNIQTYQESLSRGVDRMHSLGQQGEVMFTALVNHLAQQLGREASYLQSSLYVTNRSSETATNSSIPSGLEDILSSRSSPRSPLGGGTEEDIRLPFPGTEFPFPMDLNVNPPVGMDEGSSLKDLGLEALDLSDLSLNEPDLPSADLPNINEVATLVDLDLTVEVSPSTGEHPAPLSKMKSLPLDADEDSSMTFLEDPDLEFLDQLSASLEESVTLVEGDDSETQLPDTEPEEEAVPRLEQVVLNQELDEFYASLFGGEGEAPGEVPEAPGEVSEEVTGETAIEVSEVTVIDVTPILIEPVIPQPEDLLAELEQLEVAIEGDSLPETALGSLESLEPENLFDAFLDSESTSFQIDLEQSVLESELEPELELEPEPEPEDLEQSVSVSELELEPEPEPEDPQELAIEALLTLEPEPAVPSTVPIATASVESEGLFEGFLFAEPAIESRDPEETLSVIEALSGTVEETSPPVENSVPAEVEITTDTLSWLVSEPVEQPTIPEPSSNEDDLFAAFEDLLGQPTLQNPEVSVEEDSVQNPPPELVEFQPLDSLTDTEANDDNYIAAAPDEILLAEEPDAEPPEINLTLDAAILQQLSEDLSSLEGIDTSEFGDLDEVFEAFGDPRTPSEIDESRIPTVLVPPSAEAGSQDLTLEAFSEMLPQPASVSFTIAPQAEAAFEAKPHPISSVQQPPAVSAGDAQAAGLTLENFDDFFADLPPVDPDSGVLPSASRSALEGQSPEASGAKTLESVFLDFLDEVEKKKNPDLENQPTSAPVESELAQVPQRPLMPRREPATDKTWYLGIDVGTTGLSAVLLHRPTGKLYPIYWLDSQSENSPESCFRLPLALHVSSTDLSQLTASLTLKLPDPLGEFSTEGATSASGVWLKSVKPWLKLGVPYYSAQTQSWEPSLQWSDSQSIPLQLLLQGMQFFLSFLNPQGPSEETSRQLFCTAIGLEPEMAHAALSQLTGVIVGYPVNWPDTYAFNLREAILRAGLVARPDQVFFIEDVIATVLSGLQASGTESRSDQPAQANRSGWRGDTLVLSVGATMSELALVNLPEVVQTLSYRDFHLRSLAYAGQAIDQDIICQLIYSQSQAKQFEQQGLSLADISLPLAGKPDFTVRHRLQQRLESSPFGRNLLEAAAQIKLILQHQDQFTLELGNQSWVLQRRQLESQVFLPFIQGLNRELNALLAQAGVSTQSIRQAVCTGGTAALPAIARWLRQKLPNATIVQDTYPNQPGASLPCSRVAYGLAALPLYPQILDLPRQQYNDYFLLLELLRTFPQQATSVTGIMQLLERRGINTQACQLHILALLEGHLPPGLIPSERDFNWLTEQSRNHPDYQALLAEPLFHKEDLQHYSPNPKQSQHLHEYLKSVMVNTIQTLEDPFLISWLS